jgi:hypothetical protein
LFDERLRHQTPKTINIKHNATEPPTMPAINVVVESDDDVPPTISIDDDVVVLDTLNNINGDDCVLETLFVVASWDKLVNDDDVVVVVVVVVGGFGVGLGVGFGVGLGVGLGVGGTGVGASVACSVVPLDDDDDTMAIGGWSIPAPNNYQSTYRILTTRNRTNSINNNNNNNNNL